MKTIHIALVLGSFAFLTACGYNNNSTNGGGGGSGNGGFTPQGNFSVASLSGQYAYQLSGAILQNGFPPFAESGIFTADGKGGITNGTDDVTPTLSTSTFTGTYTMANDGTGFLTLQLSGSSLEFAITMIKPSKFYLTEVDGTANASGVGEQQTASAIASVPNGTFAFRIHNNTTLNGPVAQVGAFTIASGAVTGNDDALVSTGNVTSQSLTGSFNAPVGGGRGTGTLTDSNGTLSFQYYIVDANTINILPTALNAVTGIVGVGRAEAQTGGPFSLSSLSGGYVFGSHGDTAANLGGSQTVGRFTASNGAISAGLEDFVSDGITAAKDSFTGNYTMASNGRAAVTFSSSSLGTVSEVFWMVSPTRAFFLVDSSAKVEDGTLDAQTATTFSNSSLDGQSAFTMSGFNSNVLDDRLGTLIWDGAGNLTANLVEVDTGNATSGVVTSTYAVDADNSGRAMVSLAGLPSSTANTDLVLYLTSPSSGYMLQNDGNTEIGGNMILQSQ